MTTITNEQIIEALEKLNDPDRGESIVALGMIKGLKTQDGHVAFSIEVDSARGPSMEPLRKEAETIVHALPGVLTATVVLTAETPAPANDHEHDHGHDHGQKQGPTQQGQEVQVLTGVDSIVAVSSGKGGVGKSTVAVNLALALSKQGHKVGLLDADIYGPSMPRMMGISGRPESTDGRTLDPMENHGIKVMSIGFLIEEDTPMIWRGPMVQSALEQMMRDVNWGELDILVVDMPPGTGDIQLTMAQRVPLSGAVVVSTPQDIALLDARKGLNMFRKVDVPVLGIIENMSYFACPHCGERTDIFGHGGAKQTAQEMNATFLGGIPLHMSVRETSDSGAPIVVSEPNSEHAKIFMEIATQVWDHTQTANALREEEAPNIVIQ